MTRRAAAQARGWTTPRAITLLVLLILLPNWRVATMQGVMIPNDIFTSDLMNNAVPYRAYLGEALRHGVFPVWYPQEYGGFPFVARAESGICFPPTILLFGFLPPFIALNILILGTFLTAGIGAFLLARRLTGSTEGAVVAGLCFAWSGFMVSHVRHLSTIGTVSLTPFALLALERMLARPEGEPVRWGPVAGFSAAFGLQILAGHLQTAYYAGLLYGVWFLVRTFPAREPQDRKKRTTQSAPRTGLLRSWLRPAPVFLLAAVLGIGLGAVQILPTYELVQHSQRAGGVGFDYAAGYAYDPANIVTFLLPTARGDISNGTYRGTSIFWEDYGYAGLAPLALAVIAVILLFRDRRVILLAAAAAVAYLIVLGPATPFFELLFRLVPGMSYFRFPTRFLFVVNLAIALLAAFGARAVLERLRPPRGPAIGAALLVTATAADLVFFQLRQNPVIDMDVWARPPATAQLLSKDTSLFRIYSPGAPEVFKQVFALARGWSGDLTPYVRQREYLQPSSNVLYGIPSADGYAQLTPSSIVDIWGDQNRGGLIYRTASLAGGQFMPSPAFMNILNLSGVKYVLSPWPMGGGVMEPVDTIDGVHVHRNPTVLPRAWFVDRVRVVASQEETRSALERGDFNAAREAVLTVAPPVPPEATGDARAEVTRYGINDLEVRTVSEARRLLVVGDTDYPGWRAWVDGDETPIYRANHVQRAIVVPAGEHTVRFAFASPTFRAGGMITGVAVLGLIGLAAAGGVRRRRDLRREAA